MKKIKFLTLLCVAMGLGSCNNTIPTDALQC